MNGSRAGTAEPGGRHRVAYVYGAGGHSQVVRDVLADMGYEVRAFFNDEPETRHPAVDRTLPGVLLAGDPFAPLDAPLVMAVGDNRDRRRLVERLDDVEWLSAVHSTATVADTVELGVDNVILHGAVVQANARIGSHVLINTAASVDHDNVIGDFAHICPRATLCGHVEVGEGTLVGAGAIVIPRVKIGAWCRIGAGAVVLADVPEGCTAVGSPARIVRSAG